MVLESWPLGLCRPIGTGVLSACLGLLELKVDRDQCAVGLQGVVAPSDQFERAPSPPGFDGSDGGAAVVAGLPPEGALSQVLPLPQATHFAAKFPGHLALSFVEGFHSPPIDECQRMSPSTPQTNPAQDLPVAFWRTASRHHRSTEPVSSRCIRQSTSVNERRPTSTSSQSGHLIEGTRQSPAGVPAAGGNPAQRRGDLGQEERYDRNSSTGRDRGLPSSVWAREQREGGIARMTQPSQKTDGWPTILWIAWRQGETERLEPLCRMHREHVFRDYPASAHGLGRRGDLCTMCRGVLRGSRRRVSPIRHGPPTRDVREA